ncbi:hypothetical protein QM012_001904 [Aureobasidium pullulans]|uniref:Uncharacterized protein n=1 Tax=Aureobasidium pullulans TaxID=5580 RepID=A0ABR0TCU2_AURPU
MVDKRWVIREVHVDGMTLTNDSSLAYVSTCSLAWYKYLGSPTPSSPTIQVHGHYAYQ